MWPSGRRSYQSELYCNRNAVKKDDDHGLGRSIRGDESNQQGLGQPGTCSNDRGGLDFLNKVAGW